MKTKILIFPTRASRVRLPTLQFPGRSAGGLQAYVNDVRERGAGLDFEDGSELDADAAEDMRLAVLVAEIRRTAACWREDMARKLEERQWKHPVR